MERFAFENQFFDEWGGNETMEVDSREPLGPSQNLYSDHSNPVVQGNVNHTFIFGQNVSNDMNEMAPLTSQSIPQAVTIQEVNAVQPSMNLEKRRVVTGFLVILVHAHDCQLRANQSVACHQRGCKIMSKLLKHTITCPGETVCKERWCSLCRQIIKLWRHCVFIGCPICSRVRRSDERQRNATTGLSNLSQPENSLPMYQTPAMRVPFQQSLDTNHSFSVGITPASHTLTQQFSDVNNYEARIPRMNPNVCTGGASNSTLTSGDVTVNESQPSVSGNNSEQSATVTFSNDSVQNSAIYSLPMNLPTTQNSYLNANAFVTSSNTAPLDERISGPSNNGAPLYLNDPNEAWHGQINEVVREHLIQKLVDGVLPTDRIPVRDDRLIHNVESFARKVERKCFKSATSKSEYYHLLAETYYKIQKELYERLHRKREEQRQRQQELIQQRSNAEPLVSAVHSGKEAAFSQNAALAENQQKQPTTVSFACVICLTNIARYLVNPCGHFGLCESCRDGLIVHSEDDSPSNEEESDEQDFVPRCPVCRKHAEAFTEVFFSSPLVS